MAVPISNVTRRVVLSASGTGPYSFTFEILANTDISVYKDDTLLTLTTDYTVTINANGTGYVTLTASPTGATQIAIVGDRAIQRTTDFTTGGDLFANTINDELDSQTIFAQQNAEAVDRALKAPQTDPTTINMTLPRATTRANKTLAFDSDGNPTIGEQIGDWRGNWASGTAYAKRDLIKDTSNANVYICLTAHTSSGSQPISTNADSAKWALVVDAASADASADAAALSETNAAASAALANDWATKTSGPVAGGEYSAKYHAQAASTSASNASSSASSAASAQTAAESARDSTLAAFDSFDDRYLGSKTSDPSVDNDGNALVAGALYFNSVAGIMKVYTGSAWVAAYVSAAGLLSATNNLSDVANTATSRTNLGLGTGDSPQFTAVNVGHATDTTITRVSAGLIAVEGSNVLMASNIGTSVQAYDANTAKTNALQTYSASQRGTVTTDNDGSFDMAVTNNFKCTPTAGFTLTFTNITAGQSGFVLLINNSNYTIAAASTTKVATGALTTISATGTYLLSYFSDGTNVYVVNSGALA